MKSVKFQAKQMDDGNKESISSNQKPPQQIGKGILDVDTLTSQILFIFSLFIDSAERSVPENFSPQLFPVPKLLRFEHLTKMSGLG